MPSTALAVERDLAGRAAPAGRASRGPASTCRSPTRRRRRGSRRGASRARRRRAPAATPPRARKWTARSRDLHQQRCAHRAPPAVGARDRRPLAPRARSGRPRACAGRDLAQRRVASRQTLGRVGAARAEAAALAAGRRGPAARPGSAPRAPRSPPITGSESSSRFVYGCWGSAKTEPHRARLDDPPRVHDRDPVAGLGQHAEVVRDQDQRQPELARAAARAAAAPAPA